ncbi:MAG TPA: LruC domain-containing protein [Pseudomonadales bacterium]|nr:LruC domain-containing protein [Pseudomonadales bacterium]
MNKLIQSTVLMLCLSGLAINANAATSVRLSSVVKSTGTTGNDPIRIHEELDMGDTVAARMQALENMRLEYLNGLDAESKIVLGVDVNENAGGTEKAETQAVALKSVRMDVLMNDNSTRSFTEFSSLTMALLAEGSGDAITRQPFFTLPGRTGSNNITGNEFRDNFDSTITIPVPLDMDFTQAKEVTIHVDFLDVNSKLGDPELFYDYTNGFEDLALLNDADSRYVDNVAAGILLNGDVVGEEPIPAGAPMVISLRDETVPYVEWVGYPSSTGHYLVGYEDLFPNLGDYDFNDLTVAYRVELGFDLNSQVAYVRGEAILITRGADYTHDWHLRMGVTSASGTVTESLYQPTADGHGELVGEVTTRAFNGSQIDLRGFADTKALFPAPAGCKFTNTPECDTFIQGPKYIFNIVFDTPVDPENISPAPFDPYLFVRNTNYEIHTIGQTLATQRTSMGYSASGNSGNNQTTFVDGNGFPFAMMLAKPWQPPIEGWSMEVAYPDFVNYVQTSGGQKKDWYLRPDTAKVHPSARFVWQW